jgi:hypothetical protein
MGRFHVGTRRYFIQDPRDCCFKAGMNEIGPDGIGLQVRTGRAS